VSCWNELHFTQYDTNCKDCKAELIEAVKRAIMTEKQYQDWLNGELKVPLEIPH